MIQFLNLLLVLPLFIFPIGPLDQAGAQESCQGQFISVSKPLTDLGQEEYVRLDSGPTGFTGGLYPDGANVRPPAHNAAGLSIAGQITPLDASGKPDPVNGKIVLISIGMSNASMEFTNFRRLANADQAINPKLIIVNGAQGGQTSNKWIDPEAETWSNLLDRLEKARVTAEQVQVAWVKQAQKGAGDFPEKSLSLQNDLEEIARNLKSKFPNIKIAYHSSRTRSYRYWQGLSPEPTAFETGFAVKWMIEKQINGDPSLNFDPDLGSVVAPYLSWGPYLWIDGMNPRSDGLTWPQEDLAKDCIHPALSARQKVAEQLLSFFKSDETASPWFLGSPEPSPSAEDHEDYLPTVVNSAAAPDDIHPGSYTEDKDEVGFSRSCHLE